MTLPDLQSTAYSGMQEKIMDKPQEPEWIRTSEAAEMLGVKTTQGVLHIVRNPVNFDEWYVRYLNVGSSEMPRYMLAKQDIERIANERKP